MNPEDRDRWLRQAPDLVGVHESLEARYEVLRSLTAKLLGSLGVTDENAACHDTTIQLAHAMASRDNR